MEVETLGVIVSSREKDVLAVEDILGETRDVTDGELLVLTVFEVERVRESARDNEGDSVEDLVAEGERDKSGLRDELIVANKDDELHLLINDEPDAVNDIDGDVLKDSETEADSV